jgi:hypothetical protein
MGQRLRVIQSGRLLGDQQVTSPIATHTFNAVLDEGGWLRAELYVDPGYAMTALTSPIYADGLETAPADVQQPPTTNGAPVSYASPLDVIPPLA